MNNQWDVKESFVTCEEYQELDFRESADEDTINGVFVPYSTYPENESIEEILPFSPSLCFYPFKIQCCDCGGSVPERCPVCNYYANEYCTNYNGHLRCICGKVFDFAYTEPVRQSAEKYQIEDQLSNKYQRASFVLDISKNACALGVLDVYEEAFSKEVLIALRQEEFKIQIMLVSQRIHMVKCGRICEVWTLDESFQEELNFFEDPAVDELESFFSSELRELAAQIHNEERCKKETFFPIIDAILLVPENAVVVATITNKQNSTFFSIEPIADKVNCYALHTITELIAYSEEFEHNEYNFYFFGDSDMEMAEFSCLSRRSGGVLKHYQTDFNCAVEDIAAKLRSLTQEYYSIKYELLMPQGLQLECIAAKGFEQEVYCCDSNFSITFFTEYVNKKVSRGQPVVFQFIAKYDDIMGNTFEEIITLQMQCSGDVHLLIREANINYLAAALLQMAAFKVLPKNEKEQNFGLLDGYIEFSDELGEIAIKTVIFSKRCDEHEKKKIEKFLHSIYALMSSRLLKETCKNERVASVNSVLDGSIDELIMKCFPIVFKYAFEQQTLQYSYPALEQGNCYLLYSDYITIMVINEEDVDPRELTLFHVEWLNQDENSVNKKESLEELLHSPSIQAAIQQIQMLKHRQRKIELIFCNTYKDISHNLLYENGNASMVSFDKWMTSEVLLADEYINK